MLKLSNKQISVFAQNRLDIFINNTIVYYMDKYPAMNITNNEWVDLIKFSIQSAKKYAVDSETDVRSYIQFIIEHGKAFDNEPWAKEILLKKTTDKSKIVILLQNKFKEISSNK